MVPFDFTRTNITDDGIVATVFIMPVCVTISVGSYKGEIVVETV